MNCMIFTFISLYRLLYHRGDLQNEVNEEGKSYA